MKIKFLGASSLVTGSNFLISTNKYNILIDCGLFQGSEELEKLNYESFQFNPATIDFLLLSHAHIDHSGRIPKLVKEGFKGKIICTNATRDLAEIMLVDSGHIQESDADWLNKKHKRQGLPLVKPLYTAADAKASMNNFHVSLYNQRIELNESISVRFRDAGHILGSSIIEIWITESSDTVKLVYSGDLGVKDKPIIRDPEFIDEADYLILESTYGNRIHDDIKKRTAQLMEVINNTVSRGGTVLIPSFAVGRTQELIYELKKYYEGNKNLEEFLKVPIYIDSPMATSATAIFKKNSDCFDAEAKALIMSGDDPLNFDNLNFVRSNEESIRLNSVEFPKVIISASGMCTAGRIRHHLKHNIWKAKNSVVFVGYQAEGTLGRILKDGANKVKILGEEISVQAEIHSIEGFSGHADQNDILNWIKAFKKKPKRIFLVHGEKESCNALSRIINENLGIPTLIPELGHSFKFEKSVLETYSGEILEPLQRRENIKKELQEVYDQFENIALKTNLFIDDKLLEKNYYELKNKLLDLQKDLINITLLLGK